MIDSTNTSEDVLISPLWKNTFSPLRLCNRGGGVPSLVWICLQCIAEFPDQVQLHHKLVYQPCQPPPNDTDGLLASLLTGWCSESPDTRDQQELSQIGPRLWAVIVQIFDCLPSALRTYTISLNDEALPLLQQIPNTTTFSLMTILELPSCTALTDSSISQLKDLHTLTAFDASYTQISSHGLLSLARTLQINDPLEPTRRLRGPWALRILRLKHCAGIDNTVYATLPKFPLLSVVDLRGTSCRPRIATTDFAFSPNTDRSLFSSDMIHSLKALQNHEKDVQMHSATEEYQFALRIKTLCHDTIAKCLSQKNDHFRPPLHHSSDIHADDYGPHWAYEDWSDQCSQQSGSDGEESAFDDMDEREELGGNVSDRSEEQASDEEVNDETEELASDEEVNDETEELEDLDERAIDATMQLEESQEGSLNKSQKVADDPFFQRTMAEPSSAFGGPPTMTFLPNKLHPLRDRRKPHWYDADWARTNVYVPMSLAKGRYDCELMLYRPMRPWKLLESELAIQLANEARREQARTDRLNHNHVPSLIAPSSTKNLQVQKDMKSMTAEALRRRLIHNTPAGNEPSRMGSRNSFARKPAEAPHPVMRNSRQQKEKPLKPISALQVPKLTQELLQQSEEREGHSAGPENKRIQPSTITKNRLNAAKLPTRDSFAHSASKNLEAPSPASTDLGEEGSKRKMMRRSERNPVPKRVKERANGKGGQKTQPPSFDWASWASKK